MGDLNREGPTPSMPKISPQLAELYQERPEVTTVHKLGDDVNHPVHYNVHPSGIECIEVARHMTFNVGNAIKYMWRAGLKGGEPSVKDIKKAIWYLNDEVKRLEKEENGK